ncbi:MAG: VWA domain-containing protein [Flavobacteriales bacterium]
MTAETILYIITAGIISLVLSIFIYGYKTKYSRSLKWMLGVLRFSTLFSILVLIINPKFVSETFTIDKPKLPVVVDNSASVRALNQVENVNSLIKSLKGNQALNDKFDLSFYSFGSNLRDSDSLTFTKKNTNISRALGSVNELFKNQTAPTLLITDGNQTIGSDYEFTSPELTNEVFPIILGDSITYTDIKIELLNTNRYAFLKNQFPVEVLLVYAGESSINSEFIVQQGNSIIYKEKLSFSLNDNTKTISFTIPALDVGLQKYKAQILPLQDEKNTTNNRKQFAVEVIDQATNVLVISEITHPDLGAFKKAITTNDQRRVTFKRPSEAISILNDYQIVLLYQPDRNFRGVYSEIAKLKKNTFVITGLQTDWNFLNNIQENYIKNVNNQSEDVSGSLNPNYGTFAIDDIGFASLKPLKTLFGDLEILAPHDIVLEQYIDGIASESPMLVTMEVDGVRHAIWDGENIWKWRAQCFIDTDSFEDFDDFFGKMIQYLASNKRRSRLEVTNEGYYYNNNSIKVSAQYFDQNFIFDSRASLLITVTNSETKDKIVLPMLLKNNFYDIDLNSLSAGEYQYTVAVSDQTVMRSGNFTILDFDVEEQFLNADVTKLDRLATNTGGKAFFITETSEILSALIKDDSFQLTQKRAQKVVPLIDWKYLLGIIVFLLTSEWLLRKYNGLI